MLKRKIDLFPSQLKFIFSNHKEVLMSAGWGSGKLQPYDSIVYIPSGSAKMGDLKIGDDVCTPDGKTSKIEYITEHGEKDIYTITFNDGTSAECGLDHLWEINWEKQISNRVGGEHIYKNEEKTIVLTTEQLLEGKITKSKHGTYKYHSSYFPKINGRPYIKLTEPVYFEEKEITTDPYLLGLLLGDGCLRYPTISLSSNDNQIVDSFNSIISENYSNYKIRHVNNNHYVSYCPQLVLELKQLSLFGTLSNNKFIPKQYIYNSKQIRLEILRGLMDTDGWHEKKSGGAYYGSTSKQLALDVKEIAESLGIDCCNFKEVKKICTNSKTKASCQFFMFRLNCDNASFLFNLKRKKNRGNNYKKTKYTTRRYIEKIEKTGFKKCRCIKIENPRGLYLTNNFIITHNSVALAVKVGIEASKPGNIVILCRKYFGDLKTSTLRTLIEGDGSQPPVLKPGSYKYNILDKRIDMIGGGTIYMIGFDDPKKIGSINAGFVGVDEAWQIDESEYMGLIKRLRNDVGCRQIMMVTNPGTFGHFLYRRFYTDRKPGQDIEVIEGSTLENVNLPKDYVEDFLKKQCNSQQEFDNNLNGKWISSGSLVYPQWDRSKIISRDINDFQYFYIGVDYGYAKKMALVLIGVDKEDNLHVVDEFYKTHSLHKDVYDQLVKWGQYGATVIVDPSAAAFIAELEARGMDAQAAVNSVPIGIGRVRNYLATNKFTVDPSCVNTVDELENYSLDEKGDPVKVRDHLCFAAGTKITTRTGIKNIEDIKIGEEVLSFDIKNNKNLYNKVTNSICTGTKEVFLYKINDKYLVCTKNHRIYVNDAKIEIGELCKLYEEERIRGSCLKKLSSKENNIEDIQIQKIIDTSIVYRIRSQNVTGKPYIETYGLNIMDQYQKDMSSIIKIVTTLITTLETLRSLPDTSICPIILNDIIKNIQNLLKNKLTKTKTSVDNGTSQIVGVDGTKNIALEYKDLCQESKLNAIVVEENSKLNKIWQILNGTTSVSLIAKLNLETYLVSIILRLTALYAELNLQRINILETKDVSPAILLENITFLSETKLSPLPVYNITVGVDHNYYANGILVSNCDAIRYVCNHLSSSVSNDVSIYCYTDWLEAEIKRLRDKGDIDAIIQLRGQEKYEQFN